MEVKRTIKVKKPVKSEQQSTMNATTNSESTTSDLNPQQVDVLESSRSKYEYVNGQSYFRISTTHVEKLFEMKKQKKDADAPEYYPICNYLKVKLIEQCEETNDVTMTLEYLFNGKYHTEEVTRDQIYVVSELRKLAKKGVDIYDGNEKMVSYYLREQENDAPYQHVFTHLGWCKKDNGDLVYKHFKQIGHDETHSEYRGKFDIKPKGSLEGWLQTIKEHVINRKYLEFILAVGFSASVVGLFSTEFDGDSLLFHIYGKSSRGKTTATKLAVSPFGKPTKTGDGLIKSWGATMNATFVPLRNNFGVPIVFDEASMSKIKDLTSMIYMFAENREKERMTKDGHLRKQGKWGTTIISTAEHSLFLKTNSNEGLRVRAFEVGNVYWTDSAEHANAISEGLLKNYGHAGIVFVEYLQKLGIDAVHERCKKWRKHCETALPPSDYLSRISEKFGIILATAEMVNEAFNLTLNLDSMMSVMYEMEEESRQERDADDKAYQFIVEEIITNHKNFIINNRQFGSECWGKIQMTSPKAEVSILQNRFKELIEKAEVTNLKGVLKVWKQRGYLKAEVGKNTNRRVVTNNERETVYVVLVDHSLLQKYVDKQSNDIFVEPVPEEDMGLPFLNSL